MNENMRVYGTNNIAHCFSRLMMFSDWFEVLNEEQQNAFKINDYSVHDFLLGSSKPGNVRSRKFRHMPLPIHMVIKHKNQGKIESHKWFFKGFWDYMDPTYAQIIDCGSIPLWKSISSIIWHMETIPEVGGACGEIEVMLPDKKDDGSAISFIESILLRGQYVEYKLSHYMDKAAESLFGFVSVLPGAFSTFRWDWIKGQPLNAFLKGSKDEFGDISKIMACRSANKYLAEDRIMWLEIIAKENNDYILHYIPGAKCLTDPPLTLTGLLKQRRRWFNGSLFASLHVLLNMYRIWKRSKSSFLRNTYFMILYMYMILQMLLSLVLVGSFYGSFSIFLRAILPSDNCLSITRTANVLENIYLVFLFMIIIMSTTVNVDWAETGFRICSAVMGLFTLLMVAWSIAYAFQATLASVSVIFLALYALSYALPLIMNISHLKVWDFLKGVGYSIYLAPTYINIFTIYAISNIHDVTWGSRPSVQNPAFKAIEDKKQITYKNYRSNFLVIWLIVNVIVGFIIVYMSRNGQYVIMLIIGIFLMIVLCLKLVFSILHWMVSKNNKRNADNLKRTKSSNVFNNVDRLIISGKWLLMIIF